MSSEFISDYVQNVISKSVKNICISKPNVSLDIDTIISRLEKTSISRKYWEIIRKNKNIIINKNKINNKFIGIIEILNNHNNIMQKCYYELKSISLKYPPQKNENKFIYGKLIELSLINAFKQIGFNCINLDDTHSCGSEYKNDIKMLNINISIKGKLNKGGNIILINKKTTEIHDVKVETLLCIINEGKLYFIPSNIVDNKKYIKEGVGTVEYKSSLITMLNKCHKEYIYSFPELNDHYKKKIDETNEIDIFNKLYQETIRI